MTHADWSRALADEPDDDLVRLAFADWLEEHGEGDRARYVRLSVEADRYPAHLWGSPADGEGLHRVRLVDAAFARCRPADWALPAGVTVGHARGLVHLGVRTPAGLAALGRADWAAGAVSLYSFDAGFADAAAGAWRGRLAGARLRAACSGDGADAVLFLLARPELHDLQVIAAALRPELAGAAAGCGSLRSLSVVLYAAPDDRAAGALAVAARFPSLRRLVVLGTRDRPSSADYRTLARLPALRRLVVLAPAAVAGRADAARRLAPRLTVDFTPT